MQMTESTKHTMFYELHIIHLNNNNCILVHSEIHLYSSKFIMHTTEKPFMCTVCCDTFSVKRYLILHRRIHTGEKSNQCVVGWLLLVDKIWLHTIEPISGKSRLCRVF